MLRTTNHGGCSEVVIGFADDGVTLVKGKDVKMLVKAGQSILDSALGWGEEFKVKFCPEKTVAMMFGHPDIEIQPKLKMYGKDIQFSGKTKYLGVTITTNRDWKPQIDQKIDKTKNRLWQLKAMTEKKFGSDVRTPLLPNVGRAEP